VFKEYIEKVQQKLLSLQDRKEKYLKQSQECAKEFNIVEAMTNDFFSSSTNLKLIFYRSLLILPALGTAYGVQLHELTSYNVIDELNGKGFLDDEWAQNMKIAVAVASLIRLSIYSRKKGQDDFIDANKSLSIFQTTAFHDIIMAVGAESLLHFLTSLYYIQTKVKKGYFEEDELLEMRFGFMEVLRLHQQIVNEWKMINTNNSFILRVTIQAMLALKMNDELIECCDKLVMQECNDYEYVFNREWAAAFLSNIQQFNTHMIAFSYLQDAVKVIELNDTFQALAPNEKFYNSKLYNAFKTYRLHGRFNLNLGNYEDAQQHFNKSWEIYDQHETEFDKNNNLIYNKIKLCYDSGRCYTSCGNFDKGLSLLMKSLEIVENKMPNDLQSFVHNLYYISWNLLISGKLNEALCYINRAVDILDENDDEGSNDIRIHQIYIIVLQNKVVSPSLLLHQYRYNSKLTPEGKPSVDITSQVAFLLEDLLSNVENLD